MTVLFIHRDVRCTKQTHDRTAATRPGSQLERIILVRIEDDPSQADPVVIVPARVPRDDAICCTCKE